MISSRQQAHAIMQQAELLHAAAEVQAAVVRVAQEINVALANMHPLVLSVMGGAVVFTGQLLPLLNFPLDFDYVHVSRYGNNQQGGELHWQVEPRENIAGRVVLVLDDVLDEGPVERFYCAVFADKLKNVAKPIRADFVGIEVADRFVFGFGMDIQGAWRNLPAIYATRE